LSWYFWGSYHALPILSSLYTINETLPKFLRDVKKKAKQLRWKIYNEKRKKKK
jgi:hypothetical protein